MRNCGIFLLIKIGKCVGMDQSLALNLLKSGRNIMLTGMAGAGKTYTLNQYIEYLRRRRIKYAVTASTGIAASHLNGMTIHSWSSIGVKDSLTSTDLQSIKQKKFNLEDTQVLIIDEISMLHSRQFEMVNEVLKYCKENDEPFGGIQIIVCGDFFQLPPVEKNKDSGSSKFCFMSPAWVAADFHICYLTTQYRQQGDVLSVILNQIRDNTVSQESLDLISNTKSNHIGENITRLYTHNLNVDAENEKHLNKLKTKSYEFKAQFDGNQYLCDLIMRQSRIPDVFTFKVGSLVMFTKNNDEYGYCNGTCGEIVSVIEDDECGFLPVVLVKSGEKIVAFPETWSIGENGEVSASMTQLPLRLAWAITVHKSQGMTLDAAEIDLSNVFEQGQGYVALSRLRSLSGMRVLGLNDMATHISTLVRKVDARFRELSSEVVERFSTHSFSADHKSFYAKVKANNGIITGRGKYSGPRISGSPKGKPNAKKNSDLVLEAIYLKRSLETITVQGKISYSTVVKHLLAAKKENPDISLNYLKPSSEILLDVSKAVKSYNSKGGELSFTKNNSVFVLAHVNLVNGKEFRESDVWRALIFLDNNGDLKAF